ncbi:MAG TPA: BON domain-containing protein [Gammaproteobacteria bacterium]|nr:BON domain-containing protein [Gammaproteobacteria bacterium]
MTRRLSMLLLSFVVFDTGCERRGGEASVVIAPATNGAAPRDAPADERITAAVRAALRAEPRLAALPVQISTRGGVVRLEGRVDNVFLAQHAGVLAAEVDGVVDVDNRLTAAEESPR